MPGDLLLLALGWAPLWILAIWRRQRLRPDRLLLAAGLVGFIGGIVSIELRRHGVLATLPGAVAIPVLGFHLHDVVRFAFIGGTSALVTEFALDRMPERRRGPPVDSGG